jgi:excisionase family DNA binding protein
MDRLLTVAEVSERLRVTPQTIRDYARQGILRSVRLSRRLLFQESAVAEAVQRAGASTKGPRSAS